MGVALPFSKNLALVALALPLVYLGARAWVYAMTRDRALRIVLPFGLALTSWLFAVHMFGLATHSFVRGLLLGTLTLAAGSAGVLFASRRHPPPSSTGAAPSMWLWITVVFATGLIAPTAINWAFHDELLLTGHMSVASEIQNDIYPPRHLTFPNLPLRYHYGFDLLSASIGVFTRLPVNDAIDAATIGLWAYAWVLLWALGDRLLGRRLGWLTPLLVLFGTGLPLHCTYPAAWTGVGVVLTICKVGDKSVNSPVISYFFQHPWALGIPVALLAILLLTERRPARPALRYLALGLAIAVLSLSEIVLFATVVPCLIAAAAFDEGRVRFGALARVLGVVIVACIVARFMGGFFAEAPGMPHLRFSFHKGIADSWVDTKAWNFATFGMLLPLGAVGILALRRERVLFALLFLGSIGVVNFVRYEQSWDIAKFATVSNIALSVLASGTIARLVPGKPRGVGGALRLGLSVALMIPTVTLGILYPFVYIGDLPGIPPGYQTGDTLSEADTRVVSFLRRRVHAGDLVYRNAKASRAYAQWGGLPQTTTDLAVRRFGFPAEVVDARAHLFETLPADVAPYAREGLRWIVLDASDNRFAKVCAQWIVQGAARETVKVDDLRVLELLPKTP